MHNNKTSNFVDKTDTAKQDIKPMSAKRLKHLARQAKKDQNQYTKDERKIEVDKCKLQLRDLGLGEGYAHEDVIKMYEILDNYVETGNSVSGTLALEGTKRVFCYLLPKSKKHQICTCLKYDNNV